jgi:hypothetical protein
LTKNENSSSSLESKENSPEIEPYLELVSDLDEIFAAGNSESFEPTEVSIFWLQKQENF